MKIDIEYYYCNPAMPELRFGTVKEAIEADYSSDAVSKLAQKLAELKTTLPKKITTAQAAGVKLPRQMNLTCVVLRTLKPIFDFTSPLCLAFDIRKVEDYTAEEKKAAFEKLGWWPK